MNDLNEFSSTHDSMRTDQLALRLRNLYERIAAACAQAGRSLGDVTPIIVTKNYPAADVIRLRQLGIADIGENRHPEAGRKLAEVLEVGQAPRLHFVGRLQTNKAGQVARYAETVHSVDRPNLVHALSRGAVNAERTIGCFIQIDFDNTDPNRSGVVPDQALALADLVAESPQLRLDGLMTVAGLGAEPGAVFEQLAELSLRLRAHHRDATSISAGMSADLDAAVISGATHVRVGRSVLAGDSDAG